MQKHAAELVGRDAFFDSLQCLLLRRIEFEVERRRPGLHARDVKLGGLFDDLDQAAPDQRAERRARDIESMELLDRSAAAG